MILTMIADQNENKPRYFCMLNISEMCFFWKGVSGGGGGSQTYWYIYIYCVELNNNYASGMLLFYCESSFLLHLLVWSDMNVSKSALITCSGLSVRLFVSVCPPPVYRCRRRCSSEIISGWCEACRFVRVVPLLTEDMLRCKAHQHRRPLQHWRSLLWHTISIRPVVQPLVQWCT